MADEGGETPSLVPHRQEIGDARRVHIRKDIQLTAGEVRELVGYPIVLEGGIAQGKTTLARALARLLRKYGVKTMCCPEPTDLVALAEFMKYQVEPSEGASEEVRTKVFYFFAKVLTFFQSSAPIAPRPPCGCRTR